MIIVVPEVFSYSGESRSATTENTHTRLLGHSIDSMGSHSPERVCRAAPDLMYLKKLQSTRIENHM